MNDKVDNKSLIAKRVAEELKDGDVVNLGIGLPTLVANYVPDEKEVWFQSENGFIGLGPTPDEFSVDACISNAGGMPASIVEGGAFFDSSMSFGIIRGGHVDVTVLGALEVDQEGSIANYMIPGKMVPGMGGAMDLLVGAQRVIVAMEHTARGRQKLLKKCRLPLTAPHVVDLIVTEMAVIEVTPEGFLVKEINPAYTKEEIQEATEAELTFAENLININ